MKQETETKKPGWTKDEIVELGLREPLSKTGTLMVQAGLYAIRQQALTKPDEYTSELIVCEPDADSWEFLPIEELPIKELNSLVKKMIRFKIFREIKRGNHTLLIAEAHMAILDKDKHPELYAQAQRNQLDTKLLDALPEKKEAVLVDYRSPDRRVVWTMEINPDRTLGQLIMLQDVAGTDDKTSLAE